MIDGIDFTVDKSVLFKITLFDSGQFLCDRLVEFLINDLMHSFNKVYYLYSWVLQ